MTVFRVREIRIGRPRPFGPQGQPSAIDKHMVEGPILASTTGLAGDVQGDPRHHGGPDKAIHAYALAHYPAWAAEHPGLADGFLPGAFGENLVVEGATEADICLGDRWRLGDVLLEVSQGRQPCWKLNLRFGAPDMARCVQETGRTGWYFRVIEAGVFHAGLEAQLEGRPNPVWPLARVARVLYRDTLDLDSLRDLAALETLPESWRRLAERRIEAQRVEDWSARLESPTEASARSPSQTRQGW